MSREKLLQEILENEGYFAFRRTLQQRCHQEISRRRRRAMWRWVAACIVAIMVSAATVVSFFPGNSQPMEQVSHATQLQSQKLVKTRAIIVQVATVPVLERVSTSPSANFRRITSQNRSAAETVQKSSVAKVDKVSHFSTITSKSSMQKSSLVIASRKATKTIHADKSKVEAASQSEFLDNLGKAPRILFYDKNGQLQKVFLQNRLYPVQ